MANVKKILEIKRDSIYIIIACVLALAFAYISEYFFGLKPCILCLYQRVPFLIGIVIALFIYKYSSKIKFSRASIYFCSFVFLIGTLLALFHVGIEKGIINEPISCSVHSDKSYKTIEELKKSILAAESKSRPRCGEVMFSIFGISMAGLNFIYSLILSIYCFGAAKKLER